MGGHRNFSMGIQSKKKKHTTKKNIAVRKV
jgi:hypothetical protein